MNWIDNQIFFCNTQNINDFVSKWVYPASKLLQTTHFKPMSDYLLDDSGKVIPDLIFRFEDLKSKQKSICNLIGASEIQFYHSHRGDRKEGANVNDLNEESLLKIRSCYRVDFDLFYP